ncbi:beta strand repeat-containing protein, partial [Saccharibacter floricola]
MTQLQPAHADPLLGCSSNNGAIVCKQGFPGVATALNPVLLNGGNILGWNGTASSIRLSNNAAITATMLTSGGTVIGNGSGYNINNVTIDAGSSIDSTGTAISLGSNATININGKVVGSRSMTYGGPLGSGPNIVEFVGNTTVNVGTTGKVIQPSGSDANSNGEAFNPMGGGNRIINRGLIQTDTAADIWFEGKDTATSSRPNSVENYGTITAGKSGQGEVLGSSGQGTLNFTNFTGGVVNGNIDLNPGVANQATLYNGSIINGSMTGGGDTASLTLTGQGNDTLSSGVSEFGSLTKAGSGTWTVNSPLSALSNNLTTNINNGTLIVAGSANLNGDATTIGSSGTLQLGNNDNGGALSGSTLTNNGAFNINRTDNVTLNQVISGTGTLNQNGSGTTTLTGDSIYYSGLTTINGGTLQLGNGGTSGAIASQTIIDNGTFAINRSDNVTFGLAISGTGGFAQNGTGTMALLGAQTYTGPTTINAGTLQLGDGGTSGSIVSQAVIDNGTFAINHSDAVTLNQTISGTGGFAQNGSGTTTLTGNSTYSG